MEYWGSGCIGVWTGVCTGAGACVGAGVGFGVEADGAGCVGVMILPLWYKGAGLYDGGGM